MSIDAILKEVYGIPRFAWRPTRLYHFGGHVRCGWAWLCPVLWCRQPGTGVFYAAPLDDLYLPVQSLIAIREATGEQS